MNSILTGLLLYLALVLLIGIRAYRRNETHADYLLAGRKLGPWAISLSERASGESAWLIVGLPGAALAAGVLELWAVIGCLAGIFISWIFIAKPLRDMSGRYDSLTLPDMFSVHFQDDNNLFRIISSTIILFFFAFYVAAQFNAAGKVLNVTFGISQLQGMMLGAGIIIFYTLLGGFFAVVWTDMIQALIMFGTLVFLPLAGFAEILSSADTLHQGSASWSSLLGLKTGLPALAVVLGGLSWGFGYTGQPHLLSRFMAIHDSAEIRRGRHIAFVWAVPAFFGAFFMGIVGLKLYGSGYFADPEQLMPYMASTLLPGWLAGILISGAIAAMMSTADSQLLVASSVLTEDIIHKLMKKNWNPSKLLLAGRVLTLAVGAAAFLLALYSQDLVFSMVSYAWSGLGASFGPVLVLTLYWPKITRNGALAGMVTGAVSTVIWKNIPILSESVTERFSSYVLAFTVIILVSLIEKYNDKGSRAGQQD